MKTFLKLILFTVSVILLAKAVLYLIDCFYKTCSAKYIVTPVAEENK